MRLASRLEKLERDDLVTFINACNACTRQAEFYSDDKGQGVSIEFLHEYILGNYRRLYARTLVAGINQFNKGLIVAHLLAAGAPEDPAQRAEEGALISVRVNHTPIAISPWNRLDASGLERLELARNEWLRANGYILGVRTFVNPRFAPADEAQAEEASMPVPRATIRRHSVPQGPDKMQVMRPVSGQPIARISKPHETVHAVKTDIVEASATHED